MDGLQWTYRLIGCARTSEINSYLIDQMYFLASEFKQRQPSGEGITLRGYYTDLDSH